MQNGPDPPPQSTLSSEAIFQRFKSISDRWFHPFFLLTSSAIVPALRIYLNLTLWYPLMSLQKSQRSSSKTSRWLKVQIVGTIQRGCPSWSRAITCQAGSFRSTRPRKEFKDTETCLNPVAGPSCAHGTRSIAPTCQPPNIVRSWRWGIALSRGIKYRSFYIVMLVI